MGCRDLDFFRSEVPVVNWVRDREDSDLHVLVTDQTTGGGGRLFTLAFIGRGELEGEEQELSISTSADATDDDQPAPPIPPHPPLDYTALFCVRGF